MNGKTKLLYWIAGVFLLIDLCLAFAQYYDNTMDGDLVVLALPADYASEIFSNPTGWKSVVSGQPMGGIGRFTAQTTLHLFYHHVPLWLQHFVSPINSIYLATAIFYLLCHILFLYIIARLVTGQKRLFARQNILLYALTTPLVAFYAFYEVQAIIDHAPTYTFYYIWPILILLLILLPILEVLIYNQYSGISLLKLILFIPIALLMSQGGPLAPVLGIMWGGMMVLGIFYKFIWQANFNYISTIQKRRAVFYPLFLLFVLILSSLWAYYLKKYNPEFITNDVEVSLVNRFGLLFKGIVWLMTQRLGFILLLFGVFINWVILKNTDREYLIKYKLFFTLLALFSVIYILLLPFGGFRSYRPLIIRYDTLIPVTICLIFVFVHSSWHLFNKLKDKNWRIYAGFISLILIINFIGDFGIKARNQFEKSALIQISESKVDTLHLPNTGNILSWEPVTNPYNSKMINEMLKVWKITNRDIIFLQDQQATK